MVTLTSNSVRRQRQSGVLMTDAVVALGILILVMVPLVFNIQHEHRLLRAYYTDAIAMEIVDGELEALVAGEWRSFKPGAQDYPVQAAAAANLPPGRFVLTLETNRVRLEWSPGNAHQGARVVREARLK